MQMEAGAQPEDGAESPLPRIDPKYPDIAATKWYEYGFKEGLPRLLEMFDRRKVKVTSHMVGAAVENHPALAKEIVQRGHEPAGHGQTWTPQYSMTSEQERKSYAADLKREFDVLPGSHLHAQGGYRELRDRKHANHSRGDLGATA